MRITTKLCALLLLGLLLLPSCARIRRATRPPSERQAQVAVEHHAPAVMPDEPAEELPPVEVRQERVSAVDRRDDQTIFRYYVVIGSFRSLGNAQRFRADLMGKGFAPVILANERGLYRVSVGAFDQEAPARGRLAQIRREYPQHDDVWLLIRIP